MKMWLSLPSNLRRQVEARAKCSGRTVEAQYGRAFSLGLLVKLAEDLSPLFPELTTPCSTARHARQSSPRSPYPKEAASPPGSS